MGIHVGAAEEDGKPDAATLEVATRVVSLASEGQVLLSDAAYRAIGKPPYECKAWPDRYLQGGKTVEPVYELLYDGAARPEPGTRTLGNVPEWGDAYIERPKVQMEVYNAFATAMRATEKSIHLVTLRADGGMGKTRLAVQCAKRLAGYFPGGVWFVPLGDTRRDRRAVAEAIAVALNLSDHNEDNLRGYLREQPATLLVLDNAHHVRNEEVQRFFVDLLANSPDLYLFANGREGLELASGETMIAMEIGLSPDESKALFLDRARQRKALPPTESPDLGKILDLAGYAPLAIELVAAWWPNFQGLPELAKDFATPTPAELDPAYRANDAQMSKARKGVVHTINWVWGKLGLGEGGGEAQRALTAVGLFGGSFEMNVIAATLGIRDARNAMRRLQDAGLVRRADATTKTRFRTHRVIRAFAQEHLRDWMDSNEMQRRFADHYVLFVNDRNTMAKSGDAAGASLDALDDEWQNLVAAQLVAERVSDAPGIIILANGLSKYLNARGYWSAWDEVALRALRATAVTRDSAARATLLEQLGTVYEHQERWPETVKAFRQLVDFRKATNDKRGEGVALEHLGNAYLELERWQDADTILRQLLEVKAAVEDKLGESKAFDRLGFSLQNQGRWRDAEMMYRRALTGWKELKDKPGEAKTLNNLADAFQTQGKMSDAEQMFQQSLAINREIGERREQGPTLRNLGTISENSGKMKEAEEAYTEALEIFREFNDREFESETLYSLGIVYRMQGRWAEAEEAFRQSQRIKQSLSVRLSKGGFKNFNELDDTYLDDPNRYDLGNNKGAGTAPEDAEEAHESIDDHIELTPVKRGFLQKFLDALLGRGPDQWDIDLAAIDANTGEKVGLSAKASALRMMREQVMEVTEQARRTYQEIVEWERSMDAKIPPIILADGALLAGIAYAFAFRWQMLLPLKITMAVLGLAAVPLLLSAITAFAANVPNLRTGRALAPDNVKTNTLPGAADSHLFFGQIARYRSPEVFILQAKKTYLEPEALLDDLLNQIYFRARVVRTKTIEISLASRELLIGSVLVLIAALAFVLQR